MINLKIWSEKIPGKGEDAGAVAETFADGSVLVAAFDGLGGSGSTQYDLGPKTITGAFFASRIAKALLVTLFRLKKSESSPLNFEETMTEYSAMLTMVLKKSIDKLDKNPSKLRSRLIRRLPTTLSGAYLEPLGDNKYKVFSFNAGDSRAYIFRPEQGLQQITMDDLIGNDNALKILYGDSRMSYCLHADCDNTLNINQFEVEGPLMLLAATDGCFDYIPFPTHLEYKLLDAMLKSGDHIQWGAILSPAFKKIASDDVALGLVAVGYKDFFQLKEAFRERHKIVAEKYVVPVEEISKRLRNAKEGEEIKEITPEAQVEEKVGPQSIEEKMSNGLTGKNEEKARENETNSEGNDKKQGLSKEEVLAERQELFNKLWNEYSPGYEAYMIKKESPTKV